MVTQSARTRSVPERAQIMVVDDAEGIRTYLKNLLSLQGYDVLLAETGLEAVEMLKNGAKPQVMILDIVMPGMDGIEVLRTLREKWPQIPAIMLSVVGKASTIVDAMNLGAADYLNKPFEEEELEIALNRVLERESLIAETVDLRERLKAHESRDTYLWGSPQMQAVRDVIDQVADADVTVLIHGESGVGKEVIARTTHEASNRAKGPFVKVNCAALPEDPARERALRLRDGRVHGRRDAQGRQVRARRRRHDVPRRDRRDERAAPGEAAPGAPGRRASPASAGTSECAWTCAW